MKRDWLQIGSNVAIVIGLVVVIYELNQNHQHVRAQLLLEDYGNGLAHAGHLLGENPAAAIAVARTDPDKLTEEQKIVVDAHLTYVYRRLSSQSYMHDVGVFTDAWKDTVPALVAEFYDYQYAKRWWTKFREIPRPWDRELDMMIDELLEIPGSEKG